MKKKFAAILLSAAMLALAAANVSASPAGTASTTSTASATGTDSTASSPTSGAVTTAAATSSAIPESPTVYKINVAQSSVYAAASDQATVLTLAPQEYAFTPTGVTKSYWQITFWLGTDADTLYIGYVKKSDCAVVSL